MLYGLYQSAVGADLQALKMETVSNNIANAGTSTFKRDLAIFAVRQQQAEIDGHPEHIPPGMEGHPGSAIAVDTFTDFSQGPLAETGAALDVALLGPGFFKVTDGQNDFLTRRGTFTVNADSRLVESDTGYEVVDDRGEPVIVPPGSTLQILEDGSISAVDPVTGLPLPLAKFELMQVDDLNQLEKQGDSMYVAPESAQRLAGPDLRVRQGYLEQSTVKPVHEMLSMIQTSRAFEANMNLIQHQEHTLGQLLQAVGGR